jgi:hypothetical protein
MILPLSVLLFYAPWPLLGEPGKFHFETILGLFFVLLAIFSYKWASEEKKTHDIKCCSCAMPCLDAKLSTDTEIRIN